jgi:hypothetical protein
MKRLFALIFLLSIATWGYSQTCQLTSTDPQCRFHDTSKTAATGALNRFHVTNGDLYLEQNTASAGNYTTSIITGSLGYVSVKAFNAKGDGTTSDTTAIANAIAAAAATSGLYRSGATIYFPPGTYRTSTITLPAGVSIKGSGIGSTIIYNDYLTAGIVHSNSTEYGRFIISDLSLIAETAPGVSTRINTYAGIKIERLAGTPLNTGYINIHDISIENFGIGIQDIGGYTVMVKNGRILNSDYGVDISPQTGDTVSDISFENVEVYQSTTDGWYIHSANSQAVNHVTLKTCASDVAGNRGFNLLGTASKPLQNIVLENVYGEDSQEEEIFIQHGRNFTLNSVAAYPLSTTDKNMISLLDLRYSTFTSVHVDTAADSGYGSLYYGAKDDTSTGNVFNGGRFKTIKLGVGGWGSPGDTTGSIFLDSTVVVLPTQTLSNPTILTSSGGLHLGQAGDLVDTGASILSYRNGTTPVILETYNTYTSGTNYERFRIEWSYNTLGMYTQKGSGGGTQRGFCLGASGDYDFCINSTGHIYANRNDAIDLGVSGHAFRDLPITRDLTIGRRLIMGITETPLSGDTCTPTRIAVDANYLYVCTAVNTWKRTPLTGGY